MAEKNLLSILKETILNDSLLGKTDEEVFNVVCERICEYKSEKYFKKSEISNPVDIEFVHSILNRIPDPVFIKDNDHKWVILNDAACELFGHSREELIGKSDYDFFPTAEADVYWEIDDKVFSTGVEIFNEEFQTHPISGIKRVLATKKTLYIASDNKKFVVGIIRDITEQKFAEEQLRELTTAKEKIFSILAHDMKDPFNSLIGFSGLLLKNYHNYDDEKRLKFISIIDKSNRDNLLFVENILAWASGQIGKLGFNPVSINLNQLIEDSISIFVSPLSLKDINLDFIPLKPDPIVDTDVYLLKTIIRNLISNAVKFTGKTGNIVIQTKNDDFGNLLITVKDSGVGMTKDQKESLLKETSISSKGTAGETGIGLGLKLSFEFAAKCGYELGFVSEVDCGTEFRLTIKNKV